MAMSAWKRARVGMAGTAETAGTAARAAIEPLDRRVLLAVTATLAGGTLFVTGDDQDNALTVSRDAGGAIFVNNGAVAITGGPANISNTNHFHIVGAGGNDVLALDETNGPLPGAALFGGAGNDILTGGSGIDFADGGAGADSVFLGGGDDTFQWNPGDGSDLVEGQDGSGDEIVFNGSADAEHLTVTSNVNRVLLTRDVGNIAIDLDGLETINLNANGGADTVSINDQTATDIFGINVDLGGAGFGDGTADAVIINGTAGDDDIGEIDSFGAGAGAFIGARVSLFPFVKITSSEGSLDTLTVNAQGGDDMVNASALAAGLIKLSINGGAGSDTITGSAGDDTFGWTSGDGNDVINGFDGADALTFTTATAAATPDTIGFSNSNGHLRLTRATDSVVLDADGVEQVNVNTGHLSDIFTVGDLSATDVTALKLNVDPDPQNHVGGSAVDRIDIDGTPGDDNIQIVRVGGGFFVTGLHAQISVDGIAADNDLLVVHALAGNDVVNAGIVPANVMLLAIDGGTGNDSLRGSQGNDGVVGGPGDDVVLLEGGDDVSLWNPGDGNDTVQGKAGRDEFVFHAPPPTAPPAGAISFDGGDDIDAIHFIGSANADDIVYHDTSINVGDGGGGGGLTLTHADVETRSFDGNGGGDDLSIDGGRVELAATQQLAALSITGSGVLDIRDHGLFLDYSQGSASPIGSRNGATYTGVTGLIQSGRTPNATWDGLGIVTSMADAQTGLTGIGIGEASAVLGISGSETVVWQGQVIDATTVIIKYTYVGDGNLDGVIDGGDYGVIDNFAQVPGASGYANGDFNFDGVIDGGDYGIIDNNIQAQGTPL